MKKESFIRLTALLYCFFAYANDSELVYQDHSFYQTYDDVMLTPETVAQFSRSEQFVIKDPKLLVWLKKHTKLLINLASHIVYKHTKSIKKRIRAGNRLLKRYKFENKAIHNFIFCISTETGGKKYWIKIAGPHRFKQLNQLKKTIVSRKERKILYATTPIYHNASRFARYMLYKKWASENGALPIKVPATYLFSLSDKGLIDDNHCIIIEEHVSSSMKKRRVADALLNMEDEIKDFVIHLGLWDTHFGQFVMTDKGEIFCIDLEDRDSVAPEMFFHQNYGAIKEAIHWGLHNLKKMLNKIAVG